METTLLLQIVIGLCFIAIITILFLENQDYLTYSIIFVLIIGIATLFLRGLNEEETKGIILAVDWEVIVFLICLFSIVEILNEKKVFHQIAVKIINHFAFHPRRLFYAICITTTFIATIIEDLSVAIIFIPIVIQACKGIKISPVPYLFGVTICINLASTLTPFGSAENIIIANHFNLSLHWHLVHLGVYFIVSLAITLFLLDRIILTRHLKEYYYEIYTEIPGYFDYEHIPEDSYGNLMKDSQDYPQPSSSNTVKTSPHHLTKDLLKNARLKDLKDRVFKAKDKMNTSKNEMITITLEDNQLANVIQTQKIPDSTKIIEYKVDPVSYRKNFLGLIGFVIILLTITKIVIAGLLGLILFVMLNPIEQDNGRKIPSVSHYLKRIDAKLIYFFTLLFITVYFMDISGITVWIDMLVESWAHHNIFLIAVEILLITSLLSGFLDDAPITIMFLPIISNLLTAYNIPGNPLFIAFTLGINLGGNFLPQGAACDMMTLELAKKNKVKGFTYRNLTIVGGLFALLHIILGIGYISIYMAVSGY